MSAKEWSFSVLGPLEVRHRGVVVPIAAQRQRTLLAVLILHRGRTVTLPELIHRIWSDDPPRNAGPSVHSLVMRLRRTLDTDLIRSQPHGYSLELPVETVDLWHLDDLREQARRASPSARVELLREAAALWRGEPLADIASDVLHRDEIPALLEEWAQTSEDHFEAELSAGRHAEIVPALREATARHPFRESLWAKLIEALHLSGRDADALDAYRRLDRLLAEELGLQPAPELQQLQLAILKAEPKPAPRAALPTPPITLPPVTGVLFGRSVQLDLAARPGAALVCVSGPAGVGKTTFALHLAQRISVHYPDGQWHLRLGDREPFTLLGELLSHAGLRGAAVPSTLDDRRRAWQQAAAGKRLLIVLDDAQNAGQVTALLPGSADCRLIVTSRIKLGSLVALHDARIVGLDVLDPGDSAELLTSALSQQGITVASGQIRELAEICGHLPLALRIAAANLVGSLPSAYLEQLQHHDRLDALTVDGDETVGIRAALEPSYRRLDTPAQLVLRLLAQSPLVDFHTADAAALLDCAPALAASAMRTLVAAHLIYPTHGGRHEMHDLIRRYAQERSRIEDSDADRCASMKRLLENEFALLDVAARTRYPRTVYLGPAAPSGTPQPCDRFFSDEYANLLGLMRFAAEHGPAELTWLFADRLRMYQQATGAHSDWRRCAEIGLEQARREQHTGGMAAMHLSLGLLSASRAEYRQAQRHFEESLALSTREGAPVYQAAASNNIAIVHREQGRLLEALPFYERSMQLYGSAGKRRNELTVLTNLSVVEYELDRLDAAARSVGGALTGLHEFGVSDVDADIGIALHNLGAIRRVQRRLGDAIVHLTRAALIRRQDGNAYGLANDLGELADCYAELGYFAKAQQLADECLTLARQVGRRRVEAEALIAQGNVAFGLGEVAQAEATHRRSLQLSLSIGYRRGEIRALSGLALDLCAADRCDEAVQHWERAEHTALGIEHRLLARLAAEARSRCEDGLPPVARMFSGGPR